MKEDLNLSFIICDTEKDSIHTFTKMKSFLDLNTRLGTIDDENVKTCFTK